MASISSRILEHPTLGPLPPTETVEITVDGRKVTARVGEPIAAALIAAGIRVFRTMPRSGEARGGYCLVGRCSDCLMQVDGELNVRTCVTPARDGMRVETQHGLGEFGRGVEL
jgi:predicted molibdopterin-dependent oxidoreductase YjgC